jgi:cell division septum initiation protein DivIVA
LVPLRTGFDVVLRGYRRGPVRQYVRAVEEELRVLAADRDANADLAQALAKEVEELRAQNARLSRQLDDASRAPITLDAIPARLRRMVELAREEAAEITAGARAAAEHSFAAAEEAASRLRARYADGLAELDRSRRRMDAEHQTLLQQARADAAAMTTGADRLRAELDERAAKRRAQVEADFELAMACRRKEAMREVAERTVSAHAEAARVVREATEEADRRLAAAQCEVARLRDLRGTLATQLRGAREVLVGAGPLLSPMAAEAEVLGEPARQAAIPRQRASG